MNYIIEGQQMQIIPGIDANKDGKIEPIEKISQQIHSQQLLTPPAQQSEGQNIIREIARDDLDYTTKMSSVDFRSFLSDTDQVNITIIDGLVLLKAYPEGCLKITRKYQRTSGTEGKMPKFITDALTGSQKAKQNKNILVKAWDKLTGKKEENTNAGN